MSASFPQKKALMGQLSRQAQLALTEQLQRAQQMEKDIHWLVSRAKEDPEARAALWALEKQAEGSWGHDQKRMYARLSKLKMYLQTQLDAAPDTADAAQSSAASSKTGRPRVRRSFL